jgi:enoyl-CoA hydratase/carnithine racemase
MIAVATITLVMQDVSEHYIFERRELSTVLHLPSPDGTNRLTLARVTALTLAVETLAGEGRPLVIAGNQRFFSAGADLNEIAALNGPGALEFARAGQRLMRAVESFPNRVAAAIHGYCMGGGLDLALACHRRFASSHAIFGHRGAALGIITGWGGTQRLARLMGRSRSLQMFVAAEKLSADEAFAVGLVDELNPEPLMPALAWAGARSSSG